VAVLQTILFKPQALAATMRMDDQPPLERGIAMLSICNGPREGGGFPVAPDAVMDDGLITYTIMRKVNRLQMLYFLPIVMSAAHMRYKKFFQGGTAKHLSVTTDKTMAIHTDGEVFGSWEAGICEVNVSIIPSALQVLIC
jgi:diacylglycerol kinase family enzyme